MIELFLSPIFCLKVQEDKLFGGCTSGAVGRGRSHCVCINWISAEEKPLALTQTPIQTTTLFDVKVYLVEDKKSCLFFTLYNRVFVSVCFTVCAAVFLDGFYPTPLYQIFDLSRQHRYSKMFFFSDFDV